MGTHNISYDRFFFFPVFSFLHKFTKSGKTMNSPLLLSILIVLVCAEVAFSRRSKSLAEDKADGLLDKIKIAKTMHYRMKGCKGAMGGFCRQNSECCNNYCGGKSGEFGKCAGL